MAERFDFRSRARSTVAVTLLFGVVLATAAVTASAQGREPSVPAASNAVPVTADRQIIEPDVDRRPVRLPRFPSKDFHVGVSVGTYATESFGTNRVNVIRFGYHFTEMFFVEAALGQTKVRDETFRVSGTPVFPDPREKLTYYNTSFGINVLPGEAFLSSKTSMPSALYVVAGLGSTHLAGERHQTVNVGLGVRLFVRDWLALQVDLRDHLFALDVLGRRQSTQNLELTLGATFVF